MRPKTTEKPNGKICTHAWVLERGQALGQRQHVKSDPRAPGASSPASMMLSSSGSFWRGQFSCGRQERCPPHLYPLYPHPIVVYRLHLTGLSDITVWRMADSRL